MVYHGPSRGCRACKKRRVKCDETHPACNNCTKRKVPCPGYESTFDNVHRNETRSTMLRAQHKGVTSRRKGAISTSSVSSRSPSSSGDSPSAYDTVESLDSSDSEAPTGFALVLSHSTASRLVEPHVEVPMRISIKPDPESVALGWYFTNYPSKMADPQASHGFVRLLRPLYLKSEINSPLRPAVAAIATNLLMMYCHKGGDTNWARRFYSQAVSKMKESISDPVQSKSDDLMLTTLALNFYDMLNLRWSTDLSVFNNHRAGALALLKHRGSLNHDGEISKQITNCIRTSVCHWALESKTKISEEILECLEEPSTPINKAAELDIISLKLVAFQDAFMNAYATEDGGIESFGDVSLSLLIQQGLQVDNLILTWYASSRPHWKPLHVTRDRVQPSIREAGFYGDECDVFWDLDVCDLITIYYTRRTTLWRMIRQLCVDKFAPDYAELLQTANENIQQHVDDLCKTIPFILGDVMGPIRHAQLYEINYPSASNGVCTFPNIEHDYPRAAASAGGWIASTIYTFIVKLAGHEPRLDAFPLRDGQLDWVMGQFNRLKIVYLMNLSVDRSRYKKYTRF